MLSYYSAHSDWSSQYLIWKGNYEIGLISISVFLFCCYRVNVVFCLFCQSLQSVTENELFISALLFSWFRKSFFCSQNLTFRKLCLHLRWTTFEHEKWIYNVVRTFIVACLHVQQGAHTLTTEPVVQTCGSELAAEFPLEENPCIHCLLSQKINGFIHTHWVSEVDIWSRLLVYIWECLRKKAERYIR